MFREIIIITLHHRARVMGFPTLWCKFEELIVDDAINTLKIPLPKNKHLIIAHLDCAILAAVDRFKAVIGLRS